MQKPYPVLITRLRKLKIPGNLLSRPRLIRKLNAGISLPLTLISAGAGYGKSTLVSQWLDKIDYKYVWLSCGEDMNFPEIFLAYLIQGLKNTISLEFENTLALLDSPVKVPDSTLFHHFIFELDSVQEKVILVLDDYHKIRNESVNDLIETFLRYPIPALHICILARRDPPINLYKYNLKDLMTEIRMKDLHLTRNEIKEFAIRQFNILLNPVEIKELKEKTEGWILGLREALTIYQKTESNEKIRKGIISENFKDLFFDEIIFKQEEIIQTALYISSLFERFCNEMLNFIIKECHDSNLSNKSFIQEFEKNNFFIISLDNQKKWYRFHHQFQVVLKDYLYGQTSIDVVCKYLESGSSWLIANGYYEEGIERAIHTGDPQFVLSNFVKIKYILLNSDQYNRLKYILEIFPPKWHERYPELIISKALILEIQGKYNSLPAIIDHFSRRIENTTVSDTEMAEFFFLKGKILYHSDKFEESYILFEKCISLNVANIEYTTTSAFAYTAFSMNNIGQKEKASQLLNSYFDSLSAKQYHSKGRIYIAKAFLHILNGEFNKIERLLLFINDLSTIHKHYITLGYGLYLRTLLYYLRSNFDDCIDTFAKSYENRFRMQPSYFMHIWGTKALFHVKRNEIELQNKTLAEIDEFVFQIKDDNIENLQKCFLCEIALQNGEIKKAGEIAKNTNFFTDLPSFFLFIPQFTLLKLLLRKNDTESQRQYCELKKGLQEFVNETRHKLSQIQINLLTALENYMLGDESEAIVYLMNSLELTSPEKNLMIYAEFGDEMQMLLNKLPEVILEQKHEKRIKKLLDEIRITRLSGEIRSADIEINLNGRDIKILKMVSRGHKNTEIAQSMFLSPESIKKYLYEIFQKLEVDNRIKAVLKASELGLLE